MSIRSLMNQPLTVQLVADQTDEYGNSIPGATGTPVPELGLLEQKDTIEYLTDRQTVVSKWKAFLTPESVVNARAWLNFGGQVFQVDGEPWHVYNPRTKQVSHIECKLIVIS